MPDAEDRWYFTKERLEETPSRRHGYDYDKELSCRQQAANFIQDMGQKLYVSQLCINTAIVYMHRFYVFHSLGQFHRNAIATAALFLAAKVEEQPRKVEHVLKVAHACLHRDNPASIDPKSELYQEQANDLVMNESILLQTLGFDVGIDHPHTHVVRCCQLVKASKDLAQTSYFMASNSLHLTTMCLQYKPTVVACFCIHLACKWSNWEIPRSSEGKDWFWYVNQSVTLDLLEQLTSEFLFIFEKCPTKLKKKMMSMNQNNPPANLLPPVQSGSQNETYHFAEPRKLTGAEANRPPEAFLQMKASEKAANISASAMSQPQIQHQPRHIDYKDYKEKKDRERAQRDKVQREGLPVATQPREGSIGGHLPGKHAEKVPPQQRAPPPSAGMHKGYPQHQRPPHAGHPGPPPQKEPNLPHIKESTKRKREDGDGGPDPKKYPHKHPSQYPLMPPSKTLPPSEAQTVSGIRDIITQSFPHPREKQHQERPGYQGFPPQPRPGATDKHGRPQPPSVIATSKDAGKRIEEIIQKPPKIEDESHGQGYPGSAKTVGPKPRDLKFKSQVPGKQAGVPAQPNSNDLAFQQRKAMERAADKGRKHHDSDRGMQSYVDSLLAGGDGQQRQPDQKIMGYAVDSMRKDRVSPTPKATHRVKPNYKPQESLPEGIFDMLELNDQERASESQHRIPDQKIMGFAIDSRKDRVSPTPKPISKGKQGYKAESLPEGLFDITESYESELPNQGQSKQPEQKRMPHAADPARKDRPSSHSKPLPKQKQGFKPQESLLESLFDSTDPIDAEMLTIDSHVRHQEQKRMHYSGDPMRKDPKTVAKVKPHFKTQESFAESLFDISYSMESDLSSAGHNVRQSEQKRMPYGSESVKERVSPSHKPVPKVKPSQESFTEGLFDVTDGYDSGLPDLLESLEPSVKIQKKEHSHEVQPLALFVPETSTKNTKPSSIFSPDINVPPKSIFSMEKEKKVDLHVLPMKKPSSSLFSPPPVAKSSSHRSSTSSDRELVIPPAKVVKEERQDISFPSFEDGVHEQKPFKEAKIEPPVASSPISTVNLVGMELMVDTSRPISAEKSAVVKPPLAVRLIQEPALAKPPPAKEPEKRVEEAPALPKIIPPPEDSEMARKNKKKKEKDSHRHKEKKKKDSDGRKEKKKHKDKDRERKKDSHRDKEKHREKEKQESTGLPQETHLKITIPKDKISLDTPGSGLKIKIARDRLKPEDIEGAKPSSSEGSLKIKIKKDAITNYKEEGGESSSKKKESSSHSSVHKSSRSGEKKSSSRSSQASGHAKTN